MAHVVGVPKREPCQKCSLPVFLAERLTVGKKVYHRTCLKCARCKTQLTPGSFYETETDGEYCCETCPDEEKLLNKNKTEVSPSSSAAAAIENRLSSRIADRLAFFESRNIRNDSNDNKPLLLKSLSDEEKSKSLKKIQENQKSMFQANSAFNNFINNYKIEDITDSENLNNQNTQKINSSRRNSVTSLTSSSSSSSNSDIDTDNLSLENQSAEIVNNPLSSLQSDISISENISDKEHLVKSALHKNLYKEEEKDDEEDNSCTPKKESNDKISSEEINLIKEEISNLNSSFNVTKDSFEDANADKTQTQTTKETILKDNLLSETDVNDDKINSENISNLNPNNLKENEIQEADINEKSTNSSSMVRARLHQFEVIANRRKSFEDNINNFNNNNKSNNSISNKTQIDSSINSSFKKKNILSIDKFSDDIETLQDEEVPKEISTISNNNMNKNEINASYQSNESTIDLEKEKEMEIEQKFEIKDEISLSNIKLIGINNSVNSNENNKHNKEVEQAVLSKNEQLENNLSNKFNIPETQNTSNDVDSCTIQVNNDDDVITDKNLNKNNNVIVPTTMELELKESSEKENSNIKSTLVRNSNMTKSTLRLDEYPEDLNPFKSDEEDEIENKKLNNSNDILNKEKRKSLNPFESDEEDEKENNRMQKLKPPRPPPPKRISTNPFGSESENEENDSNQLNNLSAGNENGNKRTPVPTPRNYLSKSQNPTPEPTPRVTRQSHESSLKKSGDYYDSNSSLSPINYSLRRNSDMLSKEEYFRRSTNSLLNISGSSGTKRKTKKAPAPPPPPVLTQTGSTTKSAKELFPTSTDNDSKKSSPSSSNTASPKPRKKRPAPAPPTLIDTLIDTEKVPTSPKLSNPSLNAEKLENSKTAEESLNTHLSELEKLSDEEKVLFENNLTSIVSSDISIDQSIIADSSLSSNNLNINEAIPKRRLITLDVSLLEDSGSSEKTNIKDDDNVIYRRKILPLDIDTPRKGTDIADDFVEKLEESHDRQLEKLKDNKEAQNRNRQSHISLNTDDSSDLVLNKSVQGKWKRRKGPAPSLPVPPRKVLQMLPLQEIRHELEVIEVQQQGLEKQGVMLEKMIRDRCEGQNAEDVSKSEVNSKEVEDLILQLFELVNEKNELFRRQAELMYLRRQHRLEQEQADLEYEIRVLMAQPERNKTDSDKAREESLIARLVEVVQLRNEVIDCLEMDRLREAEEDMSIKQRLEMHTAKREEELCKQTPTKLSKKEKKKQKEIKKLGKSKKLDADKDADETELNAEKQKMKKKKKKFLF